MRAHSQYAAPGDQTIAAAHRAVQEAVQQPADEHFVFLVSDADLARYGIKGDMVSGVLTQNKNVHGYVILLSNSSGEGDELSAAMAPGHAYVCSENASLATS